MIGYLGIRWLLAVGSDFKGGSDPFSLQEEKKKKKKKASKMDG